jgi:hypothetical protein
MTDNTIAVTLVTYPDEVQPHIDILAQYQESPDLCTCNIMHMYAQGLAYPNGFSDSRFFTLVLYSADTMQKRTIKNRDGIGIENSVQVDIVRIYADGSTMIRFKHSVWVDVFQCVNVRN